MASYFQNLKRSLPKAGVIHEINRWCTINKLISKSVSDSPAAKPQFDLPIPFDPEVKFVNVQVENLGVASVDHIRAGYTDENPNGSPTVITVHGCPGSHFDFRYLATPLRESGVRVIRINLPGFGSTLKPHDFVYTPTNKANFVGNLLHAIGINKVSMAIGHSMGGGCVVALASTHPNLVSSYALLASCGTRPHRGISPYLNTQLAAALLDIPVLGKLSSAFLNRKYAKLGFNLAKTIPDEIGNSHRLCANTDFDFNTKCLSLIGDKRIPVLIGYGLDDLFIEHAIFNELSTILRLPTLDEMARLNEAKSKVPHVAYDLKTGMSRQLVFDNCGHYLQKFHATYIGKVMLTMLNDIATT